MSVKGEKGTKERKVPEWESELWDYLSSGEGVRCPIYSHCQSRLSGGWCPSDNLGYISQLLDDKQFAIRKYDFMGESGGCGGIFQLVERLAQKYLRIAEVYCPPVPTEIISLADEQHPIEVRLMPLKIHHGAIWYLKGSWIIQLNEKDSSSRRRFSLFHEVFHILAHRRATAPVFRKSRHGEGSFNELLADYFASSILIPRAWVNKKWAVGESLNSMARIFDVPEPLMWLRLREMGLV